MPNSASPINSETRNAPARLRSVNTRGGSSGSAVWLLDHDEGGEQDDGGDQQDDRAGGRPAALVGLGEAVDESNQAERAGDDTGDVVVRGALGAAFA